MNKTFCDICGRDIQESPDEEDIPDLGREALMCNKCGWPTYPACKEWCNMWCTRTKNNKKSQE